MFVTHLIPSIEKVEASAQVMNIAKSRNNRSFKSGHKCS